MFVLKLFSIQNDYLFKTIKILFSKIICSIYKFRKFTKIMKERDFSQFYGDVKKTSYKFKMIAYERLANWYNMSPGYKAGHVTMQNHGLI